MLVPRPTSSISTRLSCVALCRIFAVSVISTIKVERPPARSSAEPMRVKIRSIGPSLTRLAGTKLPHSASKTISAVWRMYVDLPPIFGPVIISILRSRLRLASLATKVSLLTLSTTGWRPASMSIPGSVVSSGLQKSRFVARSAKQVKTSNWASASALACIAARSTARVSSRSS